jgi:hypothetical protein
LHHDGGAATDGDIPDTDGFAYSSFIHLLLPYTELWSQAVAAYYADNILVGYGDNKCHQQGKANEVYHTLSLGRNAFTTAHPFQQYEYCPPTIQGWQRQDVEDGKVDA